MKNHSKFLGKAFALLLSLCLIFANTVSGTLAFLSVNTGRVQNTFIPFDTSTSDLIISKRVEHPLGEDYKIPDNISFDFKVSLGAYFAGYTVTTTKGAVTADTNGDFTVSVKPDEAISIQGIDEGTAVSVTEIEKGGGFSVKGEAVKNVVISNQEFAKADFVNIYTPEKVISEGVTLKGAKTLSGREWKEGDSFTFILEQQKSDESWSALAEKTVSYSTSADFNKFDFTDAISSLSFDKVGSYAFRVYEKVGTLIGIDYDKTINYFYINVTDIDMDGKLEIGSVTAEQNIAVSDSFDLSVAFNNAYTIPEDISVSIAANKTVKNSGSKAIGPENFSFKLEGEGLNLTAKSDTSGKAAFDLKFSYKDIGKTFKYTLSEINDNREGVTYSAAVYELAVTVSLSEQNELVADVTVNGSAYSDSSIAFENIYKSSLDTPETGERTHHIIYIAIISSACALAALGVCRRRKHTH